MPRGGCLCGRIAYEIDAQLELMSHCHCAMCRKSHGAPFVTYALGPRERFRWLRGEADAARYESSPGFFRVFCPACGSVVPWVSSGHEQVALPAGSLEGELGAKPAAHLFAKSKAPWVEITDSLPQFDGYPPGFPAPVVEPLERPTAAEGHVGGSCLCGEVAFELTGEPKGIVQCHCSRCRRARGAAHGANAFVESSGLRWTRGEALVRRFDLPEAEQYGVDFCSRCGSGVPRLATKIDLYTVPAGVLDDDPGIRAAVHIFVGSKATWFDIGDDLPRFEGRIG